MSKTIKITVSDDNYDDLVRRAGANSLQDFIRSILFPGQITIPSRCSSKSFAKIQKRRVILSSGNLRRRLEPSKWYGRSIWS